MSKTENQKISHFSNMLGIPLLNLQISVIGFLSNVELVLKVKVKEEVAKWRGG